MSVWGAEVEVASDLFEGSGMTDSGTSEAPYGVVTEGRVRVVEYLIRTNGQGQMVSLLGPCWCGVSKKEWHDVH